MSVRHWKRKKIKLNRNSHISERRLDSSLGVNRSVQLSEQRLAKTNDNIYLFLKLSRLSWLGP